MGGTNRTIARVTRLVILAALAAALASATGALAAKPAPIIKGASTYGFPEEVHGTSVAIGPDGTPWFGIFVQRNEPLSIAHEQSGKLEIVPLQKEGTFESTTALQFDSQGALWFGRDSGGSVAIARRMPDGALTQFELPGFAPVSALTFGPEGDIWFLRGSYGEKAEVGRLTSTGAVTQFPLGTGSDPTSIALGPDGALWFNEEGSGKIGRITTGGEMKLFPLPPKVQPRQIVAGPDGAMWFGENARTRRYGKLSDRIGRITVDGQVSELPVPFGTGTTSLVADTNAGVIWFATDEGDFSSVSPSGNVGARGCVGCSGDPILSLALAPGGELWFAAGHAACLMCGGGSDLIIANEGTNVGEIPAGALAPADPDGPPAVDPFANQTDNPPPPIARTEKPREVERNFADLTGYVNSRGYPTTWLFRWGKTKNYGHKTFLPEYPFEAEEGAARIGEEIFGLCPGTTYHYEIVAYGPGGRALGGDRSFRTPRANQIPERCLTH